MFETYEATGDVAEACAKAQVGLGTLYSWRPGFEGGGYEALEQEQRSRARHRTRLAPIAAEIVQEVIAYKRAQPEAGYRTVAQRVGQAKWADLAGSGSGQASEAGAKMDG